MFKEIKGTRFRILVIMLMILLVSLFSGCSSLDAPSIISKPVNEPDKAQDKCTKINENGSSEVLYGDDCIVRIDV